MKSTAVSSSQWAILNLEWPEFTSNDLKIVLKINLCFRIGKKKLGISEVVVGRPLFILNEIYSTEKTYVNNLNALVTVYQEPMQGMIFQFFRMSVSK